MKEHCHIRSKKEAVAALNLIPFTEDLNQEILQISNLKEGSYQLYIDKILVASLNSLQLSEGINLALNTATPQYRQSLEVMKLCNEYQSVQGILRNISYIEIKNMSGYKGDIHNFETIQEFITQKIAVTTQPYTRSSLAQYLINKPKQHFSTIQLKEIRDKVYQANIPVSHFFELIKNNTK